MQQSRFFVDAMLGNIARKLRLLGYDSKYFSNIDDEDLIKIAKKEDRTIITKDRDLARKADKLGLKPILVMKSDEIEQFRQIVKCANMEISQINGENARCTKCNHITGLTDKDTIKERIPEKVYQTNDKFWVCENCSQVYWEGTHIKNLQKFVEKVNERA